MWRINKLKKNENGSVTVFVLAAMLLFIMVSSIMYMEVSNKINAQSKRVEKIQEEYEKRSNSDAIETLYNELNNVEIANLPKLKIGMIPVKWNEASRTWVKADKTNANKDWYDYSTESRKWANVVTVKATGKNGTTRAQYMQAEVGTPILEEDITTMFVWIPRYSYKITKGYHQTANGTGEIDIEFLLGKGDNFVSGTGKAERTSVTNGNDYVVHPAFTADTSLGGSGKEITGFWVGKFESSNKDATVDNAGLSSTSNSNSLYGIGDGQNVTIRPNVTSWRYTTISNIFTVCQAMNANNNIHGLGSDTVTTMMQNSQWGAVTYLAQSDYGNKQTTDSTSGIWNNSYYEGITTANASSGFGVDFYGTTLTGMSGIGIAGDTTGTSRDNSSNYYSQVQTNGKKVSEDGESITIAYNVLSDINGSTTSTYTNTYYRYYTENGQKASTTQNVYGIYDMAGGAWEYMASYLENGTTDDLTDFKALKIEKKYQTAYAGTGASSSAADRTTNYKANQDKYGDALWETSNGAESASGSWNGDYSYFPYFSYPFFKRGGSFEHGTNSGVFAFSDYIGGEYDDGRFPRSCTIKYHSNDCRTYNYS